MNKKNILNLLNYLHKIECLTSVEIDKEDKGKALYVQGHLPWVKAPILKEGEEITSFTLYLGVFYENEAYEAINKFFDATPFTEHSKAKTCFCECKLTPNGQYVKESLKLSLMPWAIGKVLTGDINKTNWEEEYKEYERTVTREIEKIFEERNEYPQLRKALEELVYLSPWIPSNMSYLKKKYTNREVKCRSLSPLLIVSNTKLEGIKGKQHVATEVEPSSNRKENEQRGILKSFFLKDIETIMNSVRNGDIGKALEMYLDFDKKRERVDLGKDTFRLKDFNEIEHLKTGKWPSENSGSLNLMQQSAVNLFFSKLLNDTYILSLNGPPGTGKTTLLREIFANIITVRAEKLVSYSDPADAFGPRKEIIDKKRKNEVGQYYKYNFYKPASMILQDGIVVASSNNTAVKNIIEELPCNGAIKGYVDHPKAQYFKEIAQQVLDDPEAWGMICAIMGKKANRMEFVDRFWFGHGEGKVPKMENKSMKMILQDDAPLGENTWKESVEAFRTAQQNLEDVIKKMIVWKNQLDQYCGIQAVQQIIQSEFHELYKELVPLEEQKSRLLNYKELSENIIVDLRMEYRNEQDSQSFWEKLWRWTKQNDKLKNIQRLLNDIDELHHEITESEEAVLKKREEIQQKVEQEKKIAEYLDELKGICEAIPADFQNNVQTDDFWLLDGDTTWEKFQKSSLWTIDELEKARTELFLQSLALHRSFVEGARKQFRNNLSILMEYLKGSISFSEVETYLPDLWNTFFLVVPIVSTTFASLSNMMRGLGRESIGWLIIDEAGQASPQAAVGGIWRAKRVFVVGDPLQIQPIQKIPDRLLSTIRGHYGISDDIVTTNCSVQSLADSANPFGTYIERKNESKKWIGVPLYVHFRCLDPMFSIANEISYGGKMVYATIEPDVTKLPPWESQWLDVKGRSPARHWIREQGDEVLKLVKDAFGRMEKAHEVPSLGIISPFREVANELKKELRKQADILRGEVSAKDFHRWIADGVGTVNTFQGKAAGTIVLCMGLDGTNNSKAEEFAAKEANILNVAATRAKYRFIVVGDRDLWEKWPYFKVAIRILESNDRK